MLNSKDKLIEMVFDLYWPYISSLMIKSQFFYEFFFMKTIYANAFIVELKIPVQCQHFFPLTFCIFTNANGIGLDI